MFNLTNNSFRSTNRTQPQKSSLLLAIATRSILALTEAVSGGASVASDYCYMRTAEGRYVALNDICGTSAPGGIPNRINRAQPDEPIRTSTPAQPTRSPGPGLAPLEEETPEPTASEADTPTDNSAPQADTPETTSDAPAESEAGNSEDNSLPDATDATQGDNSRL